MKPSNTYSKLFNSALTISSLTFFLYLLSALYMKGYLGFFGADAAWFSPSIFQLITLGVFPIGISIALICLFTFFILSNKNPLASEAEQAAHDIDKHAGKTPKEIRKINLDEFKLNWRKEAKKAPIMFIWILALVFFSIFLLSSGFYVFVGLKAYLPTNKQPLVDIFNVLIVVIPLFCIFVPPVIVFFITKNINAKRKKKKELEEAVIRLSDELKGGSNNQQTVSDFQKHVLELKTIDADLTPKSRTGMDIFSILFLSVIVLGLSFLSGLAAAAKDYRDFNEYQSINVDKKREDGSGTPTWIIFTDGKNILTYERNLSSEGFYYRSSESKLALKITQIKVAEANEIYERKITDINIDYTKKQFSNLISLLKTFRQYDGEFPKTLSSLKNKIQSIPSSQKGTDYLLDAWKNQIEYKIDGDTVELISRGRDFELGTGDDIHEKYTFPTEKKNTQ